MVFLVARCRLQLTQLAQVGAGCRASVRPLNEGASGLCGWRAAAAFPAFTRGRCFALRLCTFPAALGLSCNAEANTLRGYAALAHADRRDFGVLEVESERRPQMITHRLCPWGLSRFPIARSGLAQFGAVVFEEGILLLAVNFRTQEVVVI